MPYSLYEHILGGLLGQAFGDAFAMPALLHPEDTWARYGGWLTEFHPGPAGHPAHDGLPAGRVTDDTEQAFALAERIIRDGGVTVEGAAEALLSWYESVDGDTAPFVGPSTRKACRALKRGTDPRETGLTGDTNGGAMRICPVGLIHPGDPSAAARDAAAACRPSHFTDVAVSAAAAVAGAWLWRGRTVRSIWGVPMGLLVLLVVVTMALCRSMLASLLMVTGVGLALAAPAVRSRFPFALSAGRFRPRSTNASSYRLRNSAVSEMSW